MLTGISLSLIFILRCRRTAGAPVGGHGVVRGLEVLALGGAAEPSGLRRRGAFLACYSVASLAALAALAFGEAEEDLVLARCYDDMLS
ncbi:hypothetical protein Cni_G19693 [Canna indica]|uniref:Uncharacterized protein n=1 Tax=Canna indica TaxID=4628 RepID=A0AAQ3QIV1_9LILI|nr:hypothetical protein Cni_G19693 [Canna indica]